MQVSCLLRNSIWLLAVGLCAQDQPTQGVKVAEVPRMRPRGSANDYQAHARVGSISIGAEFMRHSVPTPQSEFSTEEYVTVEVGFFGAPGDHTKLSVQDFSLKVNGKKAVQSLQYGMILSNLKDPDWIPPETDKKKGAGGLSTGGDSNPNDPPPAPPKMPRPLVHIMEIKVEKAALPEGDRPLPEAGLLFFPYRGVSDKIKSVELIYSGAAGKATITLNP